MSAIPQAQELCRITHDARENLLSAKYPRPTRWRVRGYVPERVSRRFQSRLQLCGER